MAKRAASSKPTRQARKKPGAANSRGGRSGTNDRPTRSRRPPRTEADHLETVGEFVSRKAWDEHGFGGVLAYLAGLMDQPELLLNELSGGEDAKGNPTPLNKFGDDELRHRLRGAALCLNEMPGSRRNRPGVVVWTERAGAELVELQTRTRAEGWKSELGYPALRSLVLAQARQAVCETVLEALRAALAEDVAWYVSRDAAAAIYHCAEHASPAGRSQMIAALRSQKNVLSHGTAAVLLGRIASWSTPAERREILADLRADLHGQVDKDLRAGSAEALGEASANATDAEQSDNVAALNAALFQDEDEDVRCRAVGALGAIATFSPCKRQQITADLRVVLRTGRDTYERADAALKLGKIAIFAKPCDRSEILNDLRSNLSKVEDYVIRTCIVRALGMAVVLATSEQLIEVFTDLGAILRMDEDSHVRCAVVEVVGECTAITTEESRMNIISGLQAALREDTAHFVRTAAAKAFAKVAAHASSAEQSQIFADLRGALREEKEESVRRAAVEALGGTCAHATSQECARIVEEMRAALRRDESVYVRRGIAASLGTALMHSSPRERAKIIETLEAASREDKNTWVRIDATEALRTAAGHATVDEEIENTRNRLKAPEWARLWKHLVRAIPAADDPPLTLTTA